MEPTNKVTMQPNVTNEHFLSDSWTGSLDKFLGDMPPSRLLSMNSQMVPWTSSL